MEEYVSKDSIVRVRTHNKEFCKNFYRNYKKPSRAFFGLITVSEGEYVYQTIDGYAYNYQSTKTQDELAKRLFGCDYKKYYILDEENNVIYKKPKIEFILKNNRTIYKHFETDKEMEEYLLSLKLKCLENCVKI